MKIAISSKMRCHTKLRFISNDIVVTNCVVVVVTGMAEDHGAPKTGPLSRAWTSDCTETESRQRVNGANSP